VDWINLAQDRDQWSALVNIIRNCGGKSMSICEKTTTLIILDLQLVYHFIDGTCIAITNINATTLLLLPRFKPELKSR
jgi:hypothetical protein